MPATVCSARINLVSLFCADHVALADWYADAFGWEDIPEVRSPLFTALDTGTVALGFHHDDAYDLLDVGERRHPTGTRMHITLDVGGLEVVDGSLDVLVLHGATILKAPFTTYYDARQIVFADPEGNVVRLSSTQAALYGLA